QSLEIKMLIYIQRRSIKFQQILAFCFWTPSSLLFAFPLAIAIYRVLDRPNFWPAAGVYFGLILLWTAGRFLRGLRVMLQYSILHMMICVLVVSALVVFGVGGYFEHHHSLIAYLDYFFRFF
ncbi:hypothetical protein JW992_07610, partial [candidate division KSB1 bacterium]|nr:hypothetical protein [candidate division KSB1 bacterium]